MKKITPNFFVSNNSHLLKSLQFLFVLALLAFSSATVKAQNLLADWTSPGSGFTRNFFLPGERPSTVFRPVLMRKPLTTWSAESTAISTRT